MHHNVFELDVPMKDHLSMEAFKPIEDLRKSVDSLVFAHKPSQSILNVIVQVSIVTVLHYQQMVVLVLQTIVELHHVLVVHSPHNSSFGFKEFLPLAALSQIGLFDGLYGHLNAVLVLGQIHLPELPLAYLFDDLISSNLELGIIFSLHSQLNNSTRWYQRTLSYIVISTNVTPQNRTPTEIRQKFRIQGGNG